MKTLLKRTWLAGLAAACLAAPALRAEITDWAPFPPDEPMNVDTTKGMRDPNLVTLPATATTGEKLYAAWAENGGTSNTLQIRVAVYQDKIAGSPPTWKQIDTKVNGTTRSAGFGINFDTNATAWVPRLVVHNGSLYATWYESIKYVGKIRVSRYNGDDANPNWTFVDGNTSAGLNYSGKQSADMPAAVSFGGRLVVFWTETVAKNRTVSGTQLRARAYTGSQWVWLDGGTAAGLNIDPKLGASAGRPVVVNATGQPKLYVSFRQITSTGVTQLRVKVYQGGSQWANLWKVVDGGGSLNLDPTKTIAGQNAVGDGTAIFCAWSEVDTEGVPQMRVARYDGSNDDEPVWQRLDGGNPWGLNYNPDERAILPVLRRFNGKLYLQWNENWARRVAVWDPAQGQWDWADGGGARSNAYRYEDSSVNGGCFGEYGGQLLLFNQELIPASDASTTSSLGHVLFGIEESAP